jgi:peptidoglycan/xylan/chitin deacetylase (PgdA/CDA1 family)
MPRESVVFATALSPPAPRRPRWSTRLGLAVLGAAWPRRLAPRVLGAWPSSLAVLVYHRIDDPARPGFFGDASNVSASPERFAEQMDYVARHFDPVALEDVEAAAAGQGRLPRRAVLVTFDDGYRDVLTQALPALRARSVPATLFVATGFMGDARCFAWDGVVEMVRATRVQAAGLPWLGDRPLRTREDRASVCLDWIGEAKRHPHAAMEVALDDLAAALGVERPVVPSPGSHLTWDEIRTLRRAGVAIGAHTVTHPIMSRVPLSLARREIVDSRQRIETELGERIGSFAFPNGRSVDFSAEHEAILREEGFALGFGTRPGPTSRAEIRQRPFAVRRTCVTAKDDVARLAFKIAGLSRLKDF